MNDDTNAIEKVKVGPTVGGVLGKTLSLAWIRPLIYNLGGRKLMAGGGGLAVISQVVASDMADWPKAIACLAAAVVAVGTGFTIAHEDQGKE